MCADKLNAGHISFPIHFSVSKVIKEKVFLYYDLATLQEEFSLQW
jgi:hypothetical protein